MRNLERNVISNLISQESRLTRQRPSQNGHGSMTEVEVKEERVDIDDIEDRKLENLSEVSLHIRDMRRFPIQKEKHARWGEEVFAGKMALKALSTLSESDIISPSQREKVMQALEKGKFLLQRLESKTISVEKKLGEDKYENEEDRKLDRKFIETVLANEYLVSVVLAESLIGVEDEEEKSLMIDQFIDKRTNFANQGLESWNNLVTANLRLVVSIAKRYQYRGVDLPDLIGYGQEGLVIAAADFDSKKGCQFSTYAVFWIKQKIAKAIVDYGPMIRLPVYIQEEINRGIRAQMRDLQEGEHSDLPEKIQNFLRFKTVYSLDESTTDDYNEDRTLGDKIHNEDQNVEDIVQKRLRADAVKEALATLEDRQRRVLELRFGLDDDKPKSLEEIGREFSVTRERIRQIEAKALKKLRDDTRSEKLRPFLKDE